MSMRFKDWRWWLRGWWRYCEERLTANWMSGPWKDLVSANDTPVFRRIREKFWFLRTPILFAMKKGDSWFSLTHVMTLNKLENVFLLWEHQTRTIGSYFDAKKVAEITQIFHGEFRLHWWDSEWVRCWTQIWLCRRHRVREQECDVKEFLFLLIGIGYLWDSAFDGESLFWWGFLAFFFNGVQVIRWATKLYKSLLLKASYLFLGLSKSGSWRGFRLR